MPRSLIKVGFIVTTLFAFLNAFSANALEVAVCHQNTVPATAAVLQNFYDPEGQPLSLILSEADLENAQCESVALPGNASEINWAAIVASPSAAAGQESGYLLQGALSGDEQFAVSEISALASRAADRSASLAYGENLLARSESLIFGMEERASWNGAAQLQCRAGEKPAGLQLLGSGEWPEAAGARLFIEASGSGEFSLAVSDDVRLESEAPLRIGEISIESLPLANPFQFNLPTGEASWQAVTILCPADGGSLKIERLAILPAVEQANGSAASTRSAWLWSPQLWLGNDELLWDIVSEQDLNELYITVPIDGGGNIAVDDLREFVTKSAEQGVGIWPVIGDRRDVLRSSWAALRGRITEYARFNGQQASGAQLKGVQLDIEPYLLNGFALNPAYWRERYLETIAFARATVGPFLNIDLVVPVWWGTHPDFGEAFLERLVPYGVSLTVMNYRTDVLQLLNGAQAFLQWGERNGRQVSIGLEAGTILNEQQALFRPADESGELWQLQLGEHALLVWFAENQSELPGTAFELYLEREFSGGNISFSGDLRRLNTVADFLQQSYANRTSFRGISLHGLDEIYRQEAGN